MQVQKNNKLYPFDINKIERAIIQAYNQIDYPDFEKIKATVSEIYEDLINRNEDVIDVKDIENTVMGYLYLFLPEVAREYSKYKMNKERINKNPTDIEKVLFVKTDVSQENANKNAELAHIKNAYLAEIPSRDAMREALPKDCLDAHDRNIVYFHDMAYSIRETHNCELLNLDALLQNGFELGGRWIEKPHSFATACTVVTQVLSHVTGNTYGLK